MIFFRRAMPPHVMWKSVPYCTNLDFFATACDAVFSQEVLYIGTHPILRTAPAHPVTTVVA